MDENALRRAARKAQRALGDEVEMMLSCGCSPVSMTGGVRDESTLDAGLRPDVRRYRKIIAEIDAALASN